MKFKRVKVISEEADRGVISCLKCEKCGQGATVHVTEIVSGRRRERHLWRRCAAKEKVVTEAGPSPAGRGGPE